MKFRLNPILAAIVATGSFGIANAAAVVTPPEVRSEVRTVIVDSDVTIQNGQGTAEVFITQGEPGTQRKEVKIIAGGDGQHFSWSDTQDVNVVISKAMSEAFSSATSMPMARNIKNAPYSAEVISEKVQTLPDGNQITRKTSTLSYRDSAGRTRQETRDAKGEVKSVQIHDAVEGSRYVISPSKKTATKLGIDKDLQKRIEEIKEKAKAMAKDGKAHVIERSSGPGEEIIVKRIESPATDGKKEIHEEVKVNVVRASGPGGANAGAYAFKFGEGESMGRALGELTRMSPIGTSFQDLKWSAKSTTTSLGTKEIEGVRVEGKNVSYTIPAGEIGNKNPIVVSTETWYSPELQVTVYSKHSDPRSGDSIYRLAGIKRGEPAATLFMVPDGYSVKDMPSINVRTAK